MKIERYQPNRVSSQVANRPLASAASGNAVFGANIQSGQQAGNLALAAIDTKNRIDTTSAEEALVNFEREKNDLFFNPDTGYFNTQGKNAYDGAGAAGEALQKLKEKYGANLNDRARSMFTGAADAHISNSQKDIDRHASSGLKVWEVATVQAQTENAIENSSLYWNQPEQLATYRALGRQSVIDSGEMEGIGAEAINENLQTFDSTFASGAIEAAIAESAERGSTTLDKFSSMLEGPDRVKLESLIKDKLDAEETEFKAQMAITAGAKLADLYDNVGDIRREANLIEDPDQRKATLAEAVRQFKIKQDGEKQEQAELFESAEEHIYNGGSATSFKASNPSGWNKLTVKQKKSLETGAGTTSNQTLLTTLQLMPKAELAKINPNDYVGQLSASDRAKLTTAVKSARNVASPTEKAQAQQGRTRNAQVQIAVEGLMGSKKSAWSDDDITKSNHFYDLVDSEYLHRKELKGAELTSREYTDMLGDLTRNVVRERSMFGFDYLAPDSDETISEIPAEELREYADFLRSNDRPVTSANLLAIYNQVNN